MSQTEDEIQIFNDSLDHCIAQPEFLDIFYEKLIGGSEAVAAKFEGVDMGHQKRALKASLYTAMLAADGNEPAIEHLRQLSVTHRGLSIQPEHYDLWLDCLIATVRESGGAFDVRVESAWRHVLEVAIGIMKHDPLSTEAAS